MRRTGATVHCILLTLLLLLVARSAPAQLHDQPAHAPTVAADAAADAEAKANGLAAAPTFAPKAGAYHAPLLVTLTSATTGATIYYTTNGSAPSRKTSPVYKGPIQLARAGKITVKAFAYKNGLKASLTSTAVYNLTAAPPPSEAGGTLFLATLTPQGTASTAA